MGYNQTTMVLRAALVLSFLAMSATLAGMPRDASSLSELETNSIASAIPTKALTKPLKSRHVLVYSRTEVYCHDAIAAGNYALWLMGQATGAYECEFIDEKSVFAREALARFDAIVFNNPCKVDFEEVSQQKAILDFVAQGKGFVGIHCAADCLHKGPQGSEMLGALFRNHPWQATGTWAIKVDEPNHRLVRAFQGQGFCVHDEIFQMGDYPYSREKLRVLLSLDMTKAINRDVEDAVHTDQDVAVSWIRSYEQGRVFYCSLGHNKDIFWQPRILDHYLAGIQFALGDLHVDMYVPFLNSGSTPLMVVCQAPKLP